MKEPQTSLQNKEITGQSYQKISNKNTKKNPRIEFGFSNSTGEIGMDNSGYLTLFYFYFVVNLIKKFVGYVRLKLTPPPQFI